MVAKQVKILAAAAAGGLLSPKQFNYGTDLDGSPKIDIQAAKTTCPKIDHSEDDKEFIGGFAVDDEQIRVEVTRPVDNPDDSYVFAYEADPGDKDTETVDLKKRTPEIREKEKVDPLPVDDGRKDPYLLFSYKAAKSDSDRTATEDSFVFTGSSDLHYMSNNTFIPLKQLQERLSGDPKLRLEAYTRDWLTFCTHRNDTVALVNCGAFVPEGDELGAYKAHFDGKHLFTRDTLGQRVDNGLNFILTLLEPRSGESIINPPWWVFKRWSQVAYAAAFMAKEPWSVKARFWSIPNTLSLQFVYDMPSDLLDKVYEPSPSPEYPLQDRELKQWRDSIKDAHIEVANRLWPTKGSTGQFKNCVTPRFRGMKPSDFGKHKVEWDDNSTHKNELKGTYWTTNFSCLDTHPQGYYGIYVSNNDLFKMKQAGFAQGSRDFPSDMNDGDSKSLAEYEDGRKIPVVPANKTETDITETKLLAVVNWPRIKTQKSVMNEISATEVAQKLVKLKIWTGPLVRAAEWLHRSAYSYGGLKADGPDSSQVAGNLLFGTYEANTQMIRYEEYLKRVARVGLGVSLTTEVNTHTGWSQDLSKNLPWLVPRLAYTWKISTAKVPGRKSNGVTVATYTHTHVFDLFSQCVPTLYEVELDEKFDDIWGKDGIRFLG